MHAQLEDTGTVEAGHALGSIEIGDSDSLRPIRALNRGLEVLMELNRRERATVNVLAKAVGLPRTTAYRILETLRVAGYVERNLDDQYYQPTVMVRALSEGFDDEAMVSHIARPHLTALCAALVWPVAIATPSADAMVIRETTDRQSPLALEQLNSGIRVSLLGSAAGRAYLAYCSAPQREKLLELLLKSPAVEDRIVRDRAEVERILNETRAQGYSMAQRARRVSEEVSLAIPVRGKDRVLATISIRYSANAVPMRTALNQFLPNMRDAVMKIEREFNAA